MLYYLFLKASALLKVLHELLFLLTLALQTVLDTLGDLKLSVLNEVNHVTRITFLVNLLVPDELFRLEGVVQLLEVSLGAVAQEGNGLVEVNQFLQFALVNLLNHILVAGFAHHGELAHSVGLNSGRPWFQDFVF